MRFRSRSFERPQRESGKLAQSPFLLKSDFDAPSSIRFISTEPIRDSPDVVVGFTAASIFVGQADRGSRIDDMLFRRASRCRLRFERVEAERPCRIGPPHRLRSDAIPLGIKSEPLVGPDPQGKALGAVELHAVSSC